MLKGSSTPAPPLLFEPQALGLEVEDISYVEWLLAGGERIPAEDQRAWRDTEKDTL